MVLRPETTGDLIDAVADARRSARRLAIRGGGSKDGIGAETPDAVMLEMGGFAGVIDYDPAELVLTAGAATPLAEIRTLVAQRNQMLAFDPFDHGAISGADKGRATIGGVLAAGVAGSQRLSQGGARDHLLGFEAISGHGARFVGGAKVVKNVTGYDLPKLAAGSWGRLFAMTQVTLKVLPAPRVAVTALVEGLDFATAEAVMAAAMGSQAEVAAAAYRPAGDGAPSETAIRIQGFGPSVTARGAMLAGLLRRFGAVRQVDEAAIWDDLRTLAPLKRARPLWRVNVAPSRGPGMMAALDGDWLADWAGGLLWIASEGNVRAAAAAAGGHAMLVRAPAATRMAVPALHPAETGVAALEARIRRAFDPDGVFETGRFGA